MPILDKYKERLVNPKSYEQQKRKREIELFKSEKTKILTIMQKRKEEELQKKDRDHEQL